LAHNERARESGHHSADRLWRKAIQYALDQLTATAPGAVLSRPEARVIGVSEAGSRVEVELRFRRGKSYRAFEPGEYLASHDTLWWKEFRAHLSAVSDRTPPPMAITVFGVVEEGALIEADSSSPSKRSGVLSYRSGPSRESEASNRYPSRCDTCWPANTPPQISPASPPHETAEISYDLIMDEDMAFVEGTYHLPGHDWQVLIFGPNDDIDDPIVTPTQWKSGVTGVVVCWPRWQPLNKRTVEQLLSGVLGVRQWREVRGPDSIVIR
jgi:hypothetical protein